MIPLPDDLVERIIMRAPNLALVNDYYYHLALTSSRRTTLPRVEWRVNDLNSLRLMAHLGGADLLMLRDWIDLATTATSTSTMSLSDFATGLELLIVHYRVVPTPTMVFRVAQLVDAHVKYFAAASTRVNDVLYRLLLLVAPTELNDELFHQLRRRHWSDRVREWFEVLTKRWLPRPDPPRPPDVPPLCPNEWWFEQVIESYNLTLFHYVLDWGRVLLACTNNASGPYAWEAINAAEYVLQQYDPTVRSVIFDQYIYLHLVLTTLPTHLADRVRACLPIDLRDAHHFDFYNWRVPNVRLRHYSLAKCLTRLVADPSTGPSERARDYICAIMRHQPDAYTPTTIQRIGRPSVLHVLENEWRRLRNEPLPVASKNFWVRVRVLHDQPSLLQRLHKLAGRPAIPERHQLTVYQRYKRYAYCLAWLLHSRLLHPRFVNDVKTTAQFWTLRKRTIVEYELKRSTTS